jgi:vancomycin permeability regulator SanA
VNARLLRRGLLLVLGLVALYAIALAGYGLLARPKPADVAIVFGSRVMPDGTPSKRLTARLDAAFRLSPLARSSGGVILYFYDWPPSAIHTWFVSGATGREGYDESRVMRNWLVTRGIPDSLVVSDSLGANSHLTAVHAAAWMQAHSMRRAVVVTQYFHVARCEMACRRAGIDVVGASAPRWFEPRDLYSLAREMVALPVYALTGR